jgi:thiamine-phosphate pyrophosphorylase
MKLFIITPPKDKDSETTLVTKMFEAGLGTLHLRKPRYSTEQMAEYISKIPSHFHKRIVIHSHHRLALKYDLKGIHLTKTHLTKKWKYFLVRQRLKMKFGEFSKSRSYSRLQQAYHEEDLVFSYYLIGSVFNNLTGEFYSGFYEEGIRAAIKNCPKKFIARGGTTVDLIRRTNELGFYGIAFNSYLWDSEAPFDTFLKITQEFRKHNIELE